MLGQFGGFSPIHWLVIGVVALLLFGNRLPEVARSMGRAFNEFKRGLREVGDDLEKPREGGSEKLPPPEPRDPRRLGDAAETPAATTSEREHTGGSEPR